MFYIQTQLIESNWITIVREVSLCTCQLHRAQVTHTNRCHSLPKICTALAQLIETKETGPQLIVDFLVHMEFCQITGGISSLYLKNRK